MADRRTENAQVHRLLDQAVIQVSSSRARLDSSRSALTAGRRTLDDSFDSLVGRASPPSPSPEPPTGRIVSDIEQDDGAGAARRATHRAARAVERDRYARVRDEDADERDDRATQREADGDFSGALADRRAAEHDRHHADVDRLHAARDSDAPD